MESLTQTTEVKRYVFAVSELRDLIAWPYFYWAWGVANADDSEKRQLRSDAEAMLNEWEDLYHSQALLLSMPANSDGDDIILGEEPLLHLPMLRQQMPPYLCLADYVRPQSHGIKDHITLFCTTMDANIEKRYGEDPYLRMLSQTLADRLAEATAEKLSEHLPGIRPAVGYPSMPDMSLNFLLDEMLQMRQIGITLTESGMMHPHASVSGLIISHPEATYFNISHIGEDQIADYSRRRGFSPDVVRKFIKTT